MSVISNMAAQFLIKTPIKTISRTLSYMSRNSGDIFEAHFAHVCVIGNIPYDKKDLRFAFLLSKVSSELRPAVVSRISDALNCLCKDYGDILKVNAVDDSQGKVGESGDFILTFKKDKLKLSVSLKRNSTEIKAPRPSNLAGQLGLAEPFKSQYVTEYKNIVSRWYANNKKYVQFKDVPKDDKSALLNDVTALGNKYLLKHGNGTYLRFLLGSPETVIMTWNGKTNKETCAVSLLHMNKFKVDLAKSHVVKTDVNNCYLMLHYNTGHVFQLRLHSAKNKIESDVSLKWSVQITNKSDLYLTEMFEKMSIKDDGVSINTKPTVSKTPRTIPAKVDEQVKIVKQSNSKK